MWWAVAILLAGTIVSAVSRWAALYLFAAFGCVLVVALLNSVFAGTANVYVWSFVAAMVPFAIALPWYFIREQIAAARFHQSLISRSGAVDDDVVFVRAEAALSYGVLSARPLTRYLPENSLRARRHLKAASWLSAIFGWWMFPLGPWYAFEAIRRNRRGGFKTTAGELRETPLGDWEKFLLSSSKNG